MDLWKTRDTSWAYINEKYPARITVALRLFELIDSCIDEYEAKAAFDTYSQVCGLTLLKAKNLALGSFSLILDGHGQEAGGLLRPMVEYTELLTYFRHFPGNVDQATEKELPKAGTRAKTIDGIYQGLREHLNKHASHSSYSTYSLSHLLTPTFSFRKMQEFIPHILNKNLTDLAVQLWFLLQEGVLGLEQVDSNRQVELATAADAVKEQIFDVFEIGAP